jgi:hypothetical protein
LELCQADGLAVTTGQGKQGGGLANGGKVVHGRSKVRGRGRL